MASGINIYSVFQISEISISDIEKTYFGYPKTRTISDRPIQNNYSGYQK